MTVGVLALQGAFSEHMTVFESIGVNSIEVKTLNDLSKVDRLVIPGGESTVIGMQIEAARLTDQIKSFIAAGKPVWGTCAGLIVLSDTVRDQKTNQQPLIGGLPISVVRNYYGRQNESFVDHITLSNEKTESAVFIRAPYIEKISNNVDVLAKHKKNPVAVRYKNLLGTTFHPELSKTKYWHELFVDL